LGQIVLSYSALPLRGGSVDEEGCRDNWDELTVLPAAIIVTPFSVDASSLVEEGHEAEQQRAAPRRK